MSKRGQTIFLSLFIFLGLFVLFASQFLQQIYFDRGAGQRTQEGLLEEAELIASQLVTPGVPTDWLDVEEDQIQKIGLLTDGRFDTLKWAELISIAKTASCETAFCYQESKDLFGVQHDYEIRMNYRDGETDGLSDIEPWSVDLDDAAVVQSFSRLVLDPDDKTIVVTVYVYE